ncbi:MAG: HAD family hydrolase [Planctomycetes bacterium]|nr:HAD family hydrolase [Planctomycetota bacterium]
MARLFEAVIFDLDGTLLDTLEDLGDSVNIVLEEAGFPTHRYDAYKKIIGKGFRDLMTRSLPEEARSKETVDARLARFLAVYEQRYQNRTVPYPGIEKLLAALRDKGVPMAVNSNKRDDYSNNLITKLFPDISFVGVYGERSDFPKKPDPSAALALAAAMGVKPDRIIYIGDSKTDMQTGRNAGMGAGGVLWGFRDEAELVANGADVIFRKPEEIADVFHS